MVDETLKRDAMLERMRAGFDEAQSYATGMRSLAVISHPMLLSQMARDAIRVREALARGEMVWITTSTGLEIAVYEPEPEPGRG